MAKKKQYRLRTFESLSAGSAGNKYYSETFGKTRTDSTANIAESMLFSAAFQSLENRQKVLYLYMKAQLYGRTAKHPADVYPDLEGLKTDEVFFFSWSMARLTGLYADSNKSQFSKDTKTLVNRGFIEVVATGNLSGRASIYKFSSRWANRSL